MHSLLEKTPRTKTEHERPRYGVGTVTGLCLRQAYYRMTEEEILDLEKLWVFSRGHALHEFVSKSLPKHEKEVFVQKEFSHFDIITNLKQQQIFQLHRSHIICFKHKVIFLS